jgi:hypothetical protein
LLGHERDQDARSFLRQMLATHVRDGKADCSPTWLRPAKPEGEVGFGPDVVDQPPSPDHSFDDFSSPTN